MAYSRLAPTEAEAVDAELARISQNTSEGRRYFLENYFVINTKGEGEAQQLQCVYPFTDTQEILWAEFRQSWDIGKAAWFLLLKARQIRWSTLVQGCLFHATTTNPLTNSLVIADELKRSNQIFNMTHLAYQRLPWWLRPESSLDNRGEGVLKFNRKSKEEQYRNPGMDSSFFVDAANKPSGSSRGFTLHNMHATEFGLWMHPGILTSDIIPAIPKHNPNVIAIVEGTAKGAGEKNAFLNMWKLAEKGQGLFRPVFAGWWKEKTYCKPFPSKMAEEAFAFTREEVELIAKVRDEFEYEITKEQMAWRRDEAAQFQAVEGDAEKIEQEYPSFPRSAFRSGGLCAFNLKKLAAIEVEDVRKPIWCGELVHVNINGKDKPTWVPQPIKDRDIAPLWIWEWPTSKDLYYEASDPSSGTPGLDYSSIQVFRVPRRNGERIRQCLEYRGYADPKELAKMACTIGHTYNTCEMAPECNNMTEHIGNILHIHAYPKIYRWRRQDKTKGRMTNFFGWDTGTHKHREDLIARFKSLMMDESLEIRSERLHSECISFVMEDGKERFEASGGEHDDALFAAMICCYCLMELDPRLYAMVDNEQIPIPGMGKHNTDYSEFDDVVPGQADYQML